MPNLEEERARVLLFGLLIPAVSDRGQRSADERADNFVHEREAVALVGAEWQQVFRLLRIGGGRAVFVDGGPGWKLFSLACELLHASHGDDRFRPIHDDGITDGFGGGKAPGVR